MKYMLTMLALLGALCLSATAQAASTLGRTTVHSFTMPLGDTGTASQVTTDYANFTAYDITYHQINGQPKVEDFRRLHVSLTGSGDKLGLTIPNTGGGGGGGGTGKLDRGGQETDGQETDTDSEGKVGIQYDFIRPDNYGGEVVTSVFVVNHRVNGVISLMMDSKDNYIWKVISKETYPAPGTKLAGSGSCSPVKFWEPEWMKSGN